MYVATTTTPLQTSGGLLIPASSQQSPVKKPKARLSMAERQAQWMKKKAEKLAKKKQFKMNKMGKASESDRRIAIKKPRHLFSGKRGNGKTDRR